MNIDTLAQVDLPEGSSGGPRSAADRAYASVRQAILDGSIPFGTALSEDAVATQLGMSRTPVREALQLLAREGLLEPGPRRKLVVREPTKELAFEVTTMRIALECEAVARACETASDDGLDRIKLAVLRQEREARRGEVSAFLEADGNFHFGIARAAQLPLLHSTLVQLHTFTRLLGLRALQKQGRMDVVIREHEVVVAALEQRDDKAARAAMRAHLESTGRALDVD